MNMCFVVPVYKHGSTLEDVVVSLLEFKCPIIVVDDGNGERDRELIEKCAQNHKEVILITFEKNRGKGAAVFAAVRRAHKEGFTHIFQVDSDGQHDSGRCRDFMALAEKYPDSIICGYPEYDESVPLARKNGREFSNGWARLVSWRPGIKDVLCGFRIYPVKPFIRVLNTSIYLNRRMGFDAEILVRMLWINTGLVNEAVHVTYPKDGISNFRMVGDNVTISFTFARLCAGMIIRSPLLLLRLFIRKIFLTGRDL
ncbi:MAG: glycosyltransferase family 2 protein [Treponema sp.]|nr:glycosyltransferase family 2 protein [Treponema sp.]